jgi:fructose-1,6-bisphosphatase/inositol monophosphatase family enzyme
MASWIFLPIEDRLFAAELGSGAYFDGERIRTPSRTGGELARGALHLRFMSSEPARLLSSALNGRVELAPDLGCSAMEYTRILTGEREFAVYHRLHPWDHAPGALIVTEGGGRVEHRNGTPYGPRSTDQVTIVAHDPALAEDLRGWLRDVHGGKTTQS